MCKGNLSLQSNIFPVESTWPLDSNFLERIWDIRALEILEPRARRKELTLTPRQYELLRNATPCRFLSDGEKAWGENEQGLVICRCRNIQCPYFSECRPQVHGITQAQKDIWVNNLQDEDALARFDGLYERYQPLPRPAEHGKGIFGGGEPIDTPPINPNPTTRGLSQPSGFPGDELYDSF